MSAKCCTLRFEFRVSPTSGTARVCLQLPADLSSQTVEDLTVRLDRELGDGFNVQAKRLRTFSQEGEERVWLSFFPVQDLVEHAATAAGTPDLVKTVYVDVEPAAAGAAAGSKEGGILGATNTATSLSSNSSSALSRPSSALTPAEEGKDARRELLRSPPRENKEEGMKTKTTTDASEPKANNMQEKARQLLAEKLSEQAPQLIQHLLPQMKGLAEGDSSKLQALFESHPMLKNFAAQKGMEMTEEKMKQMQERMATRLKEFQGA